jgi:hypothetical protein
MYADTFEHKSIDKKAALRAAGLPQSHQTKISKGIKLAKYVTVKDNWENILGK